MIKFIPVSEPSITEKEINYVNDAITSGWVSSIGKYITEFEEKFAAFTGVKHALAVMNGTAAIELALASYGIGEGDEVIVPDFTFIATANAVKHSGAKPVLVDIERDTLCMDPIKIEKSINSQTRAIIPVHIYGHPANMPEISKTAKKFNLIIIEDAAEAHGAEIDGKRTGSLGDAATFSFYGNKIITTGEGGMITTNCSEIYERAKMLRDHAMSSEKRYWHMEAGYNFRITNLQAALGVAQLERIDSLIERRKQIFDQYKEYLGQIPGVRLNYTAGWARNVYWMVCMEVKSWDDAKRKIFMNELRDSGIDTRPYFYPISDMGIYDKSDTPVTHIVYKTGINLPTFFNISGDDIKYICEKIKELLERDKIG